MQYHNPILTADYPDPDVIRVGEDYYMVSSSFTYLPGVPLLHSKDLVHWEIINHCVPYLPQLKYNQPSHGSGIWAPSIRYHDGTFFVFVPLPDEGIFVARSPDPYGLFVLNQLCASVGWIDPCPLWDDDGKAYMVFAYDRSRCGIQHQLSVVEIDPDCTKLLGKPAEIFNGEQIAPGTRGPKFYKYNGLYYILASSGGGAAGWQSCLRSEHVYGPYQYKIVLHQRDSPGNGLRLGSWVSGEDGRHWFLHCQDGNELGQVAHLQPMCFLDGWPFIGQDIDGDGIGEPVSQWEMPALRKPRYTVVPSDKFPEGMPGPQWQWQANPLMSLALTGKEDPGKLQMACLTNHMRPNLLWYAPNVLTQIPQFPVFTATVQVSLSEKGMPGDMGSLGIIGCTYAYLGLQRLQEGFQLALYRGAADQEDYAGEALETEERTLPVSGSTVFLRLQCTEDRQYRFLWSSDGSAYQPIGDAYPLQRTNGTGARLTLWACSRENRGSKGAAVFQDFQVCPPDPDNQAAAPDKQQPESISAEPQAPADSPAPAPMPADIPGLLLEPGTVLAMELEVSLDLKKYTARRTLLLPADATFQTLHRCLQTAFRWKDYHLYQFILPGKGKRKRDLYIAGENIEIDMYREEDTCVWSYRASLQEYLQEGDAFRYHYDFGDNWIADIRVSRCLRAVQTDLPACTLYEGAAPPEDVGGPWGFEDFWDAVFTPGHPDRSRLRSWAGAAWFKEDSAEAINRRLRPGGRRRR